MQPFNYMLDVQRPDEAFMAGLKSGAGMLELRTKQAALEDERAKQERMRAAFGRITPQSSPQDVLAVMQEYPDLGEQLSARYKTFDETTRNASYDAGQGAYALLATGDAAGASAHLKRSAEAFRNMRRDDLAKLYEAAADRAERDPDNARATLSVMLAATDPERFKRFGEATGGGTLTSFQKDLAAAGIDPESDEGKAAAKQFVQNRADPIVDMVVTKNGKEVRFVGPRSLYFERYGQGGAAPSPSAKLPVVVTQQQYDNLPSGARFLYKGAVMEKP